MDRVVGCLGGGVDSTCLVAMDVNRDTTAKWLGITREALDSAFPRPSVWLFSDTGAEHDGTYDNVNSLQRLLGDRLVIVRRKGETIMEWNLRLGTVPLMPGASHICSLKFKGEVMQGWAKEHLPGEAIHWIIGIEADEGKRAKRFQKPKGDEGVYDYPLMSLGLTRARCEALLAHLGWEVPIKSSCVHCPFKSEEELRWMYHNDSKAWDQCVDVEDAFRAASQVKHQRWLDNGQPLNKGGRAPKGMWRKNSWEEGARLFAKSIGGRRLSLVEWAARFDAETTPDIPIKDITFQGEMKLW